MSNSLRLSPEAPAVCRWRSDQWPLCRGPPGLPTSRRPEPGGVWRWRRERGTSEHGTSHATRAAGPTGTPQLTGSGEDDSLAALPKT